MDNACRNKTLIEAIEDEDFTLALKRAHEKEKHLQELREEWIKEHSKLEQQIREKDTQIQVLTRYIMKMEQQ